MPTFFRGITVPGVEAEAIMAGIRERGLQERGRVWRTHQQRPPHPSALFAKPDLTTHDTRGDDVPKVRAVCACGEAAGAAHYAWRHNRSSDDDTPLIIEFEARAEHVEVDGKDFLYTAFQLGEPKRARGVLATLFGPGILRYADAAWARKGSSFAIAMCDLATVDPEVVSAHHANWTVIAGRYGTVFRNAFTVRLPVDPDSIVRVWAPTEEPPRPMAQVSLDDVL